MIPFIKNYILEHWTGYNLGGRPDELFFIKFPDRGIKDPNLTNLSFLVKAVIGGSERPVMIVRTPRYAGNTAPESALGSEYNNLVAIHNKLGDADLKATIPFPFFFEKINDGAVFSQSLVFGEEMADTLFAGNIFERFLQNVKLSLNWLIPFEKDIGGKKIRISSDFIDGYAAKKIDIYRGYSPKLSQHLEGYFNNIINTLRGHEGRELTIYPQHYDFHASNIFIKNGKVSGVIDWEDFLFDALPMFDLYHFIKTYIEGVSNALGESNPLLLGQLLSADMIKIAKFAVAEYCKACGIEPALADVFLALYLIESQNIAADPKRKAMASFTRGELVLSYRVSNIDDLILSMGIIPLTFANQKALSAGDQELAKKCQESLQAILGKIGKR